MDDTDYPVPVVFFCRTLGSLVAACGLPHTALTGPLGRGDSAVSQLLNGRLRRPPRWETVARVLECCHAHRAGRPPLHHTFDPAFWRQLHHQMVTLTERERPVPRPRRGSTPAFRPAEAVPEDFAEAVDVLVGGRPGLEGIAEELLAPLRLGGAAPVGTEHLLRGFAARVRAHHGTTRTALLCAADRVILVTAFCEAVGTSGLHHGAEFASTHGDFDGDVVTELSRVTLGSTRVRAPADIREDILRAYSFAADLVRRAWHRYEALLSDALHECPELRLTSATDDPPEALDPAPRPVPRGLSELASLLEEFTGNPAPAHRLLHEPLAAAEDAGPVPPRLRDGYLDPAYRLAGEGARPGDLAREDWWRTRPPRDDLDAFLAAHFLTDDASRAPLLVLGHPGSGKSLLTRLLAARLPAAEFTCLRLELRHAPPGSLAPYLAAELHRTAPPAPVAGTDVPPRVLLLDGLDELLQAGADARDRGVPERGDARGTSPHRRRHEPYPRGRTYVQPAPRHRDPPRTLRRRADTRLGRGVEHPQQALVRRARSPTPRQGLAPPVRGTRLPAAAPVDARPLRRLGQRAARGGRGGLRAARALRTAAHRLHPPTARQAERPAPGGGAKDGRGRRVPAAVRPRVRHVPSPPPVAHRP
ncbi:hypothetical protein [Streptomyces sp. NEAU-H3]|uniref:NACHT N-terminal helical domain 7-containing protein n=1 Tax=Streptomyces sp. NEAU-H3 TaxID=2720636 RepID=UPI00143B652C|nr:hypothetical protein [Streptomyces sp. NEAU-H3]NJA55349.1 hypothetical protein [Streptomyces sp. NEAU-H3]